MADFLDEKRKEIEARLRELRPLVDEYNRLEKAASALSGVGDGDCDEDPAELPVPGHADARVGGPGREARQGLAPGLDGARLGSKPSPVNASRAPCNRRTDVPLLSERRHRGQALQGLGCS